MSDVINVEELIPGYPAGSDITLLDVNYQYPQKQDDGKYSSDFISLTYRDNNTGKKGVHIINEPDYEFFALKNGEVVPTYNELFVDKDKVDAHKVRYKDLLLHLAKISNNESFYYDNLKNHNSYANRTLHTLTNIFNSDMHIEDHYKFRFDKTYKNEIFSISKSYFDIEVDTRYMLGDFPEMGECPVNAVSYILDNKVTVFLLRDPNNPLIQEFENNINGDLFKELQEFITNHAGIDRAKQYGIDNLEFEFTFYDEEIVLINELFKLVHKNGADFLLAWNLPFDFGYLYERIIVLGYNPVDIMSSDSVPREFKICKYYIDERHSQEYAERGDRFVVSGTTVLLDQLVHFASRRKGQAAFPDFKLDTAGEIVAGIGKLKWSDYASKFKMFPWENYKMFVFYNIMDTLVQKCIEVKSSDVDYVFNKALINNVRYDKVHRQTVYLVDRATKKFDQLGYVIGNNVNINEPKVKFEGGKVSNPANNSDLPKVTIGYQVINVCNNLDDFDFKSLYPSVAREFNTAPNTQIGKVYIDKPVHKYENLSDNKYFDRGGEFMEDLCSQNVIVFANRWMHYANFSEWLEDLDIFMNTIEGPYLYEPLKPGQLLMPWPQRTSEPVPVPIEKEKVQLLYRCAPDLSKELYKFKH